MLPSTSWDYARKFCVFLGGAIVGTTVIFKIYNPFALMKAEIEEGSADILKEYTPRYEELRKQLAREVAKIEERKKIASKLGVNDTVVDIKIGTRVI
ncbi:unnamed protein product [Meloidogyne enterolobii]|uniref:Uncharacterized protein n=1 Tax=Meloidogyne enterolobii TaxID=390850 RepID=A0ACB0YJP3_MELEN